MKRLFLQISLKKNLLYISSLNSCNLRNKVTVTTLTRKSQALSLLAKNIIIVKTLFQCYNLSLSKLRSNFIRSTIIAKDMETIFLNQSIAYDPNSFRIVKATYKRDFSVYIDIHDIIPYIKLYNLENRFDFFNWHVIPQIRYDLKIFDYLVKIYEK